MARTPRPGRPVRGSRTGRPIMALLDLLSRRWTLRVIWELRGGRLTFRALQQACGGVSPSVLNERLHRPEVTGYLGPGLTRLVQNALEGAEPAAIKPSLGKQVNEDLFPRDEFRAPER